MQGRRMKDVTARLYPCRDSRKAFILHPLSGRVRPSLINEALARVEGHDLAIL